MQFGLFTDAIEQVVVIGIVCVGSDLCKRIAPNGCGRVIGLCAQVQLLSARKSHTTTTTTAATNRTNLNRLQTRFSNVFGCHLGAAK